MAKVMVIGDVAHVEILTDPEDEDLILAQCFLHPAVRRGTGKFCAWEERFDTTDDASAGAEQHADGG